MVHLDSDTIAFYKNLPFFVPMNWGETPLRSLIPSIKTSMDVFDSVRPEMEAIRFYMMNHAFSLVASKVHPNEPLGVYEPVVADYLKQSSEIFHRLYHYMILIVTRESRHLHQSKTFYNELEVLFGPAFVEFNRDHLHGQSSMGAVHKFLEYAPDISLGTYVSGITHLFMKGKFNSGWGGKAWGAIADTLRAMVVGETSPEIMVDTAWTLCHNNGPIFNKGIYYDMYSSEIQRILDVQRSGQIPQYVNEATTINSKSPKIQAMHQQLLNVFPDDFSGYVDWYKVEALGSIGKYTKEKKDQDLMHGTSTYANSSNTPKPDPKVVYITHSDYVTVIKRAA